MTTHRIAVATIDKVFGPADDAESANGTRLLREALRLLAHGEPITLTQLAAAAALPAADLDHAPSWQDIEHDDQGRIVGWGLTLNPTPHRFTVNGHQLYTWCAPDTLLFPAIIGRAAQIESPCPTTGTPIRLTVDPAAGITALAPATAVVSIADPEQVNCQQVRFLRPATLLRHCRRGPRLARAAPRRDRATGRRRLRPAPPDHRPRPGRKPLTHQLLAPLVTPGRTTVNEGDTACREVVL